MDFIFGTLPSRAPPIMLYIARMPIYNKLVNLIFAIFSECLAFIFYDDERTVFKIQVTPPVVGFNMNATPLPVVPVTNISKTPNFSLGRHKSQFKSTRFEFKFSQRPNLATKFQ